MRNFLHTLRVTLRLIIMGKAKSDDFSKQVDFWYDQCNIAYNEAEIAHKLGDRESARAAHARFKLARRRFKAETKDVLK